MAHDLFAGRLADDEEFVDADPAAVAGVAAVAAAGALDQRLAGAEFEGVGDVGRLGDVGG